MFGDIEKILELVDAKKIVHGFEPTDLAYKILDAKRS